MIDRNQSFEFQILEKSIRRFYASVIVADILLLSAYLILRVQTQLPWSLVVIRNQVDLTNENVIAVWYSGVNLFLTGMAALLCFWADRRGNSAAKARNVFRYGWVLIAITFVGFSFDEMGSIHERAGKIIRDACVSCTVGLPGWVGALWPVVAIVFGYYFLFFIFYLSRNRRSQILAFLGGGVLASVPIQEVVESSGRLVGQKRGIMGNLFEEGSELIGPTILFIAFMEFFIMRCRLNSSDRRFASSTSDGSIRIRIGSQFIKQAYAILLSLAVASVAMAWFLVPHLDDLRARGNPSIWYPSLALLVGGIVAFINFSLELKLSSFKWAWVVVGVVSLWLSVDFESGINRLIFTHLERVLFFDRFLLQPQVGVILLSVVIGSVALMFSLGFNSIRGDLLGRLLFLLGALFWIGVLAVDSWAIKEGLKVLSPTVFLISFLESMKYHFLSVPSEIIPATELNRSALSTTN